MCVSRQNKCKITIVIYYGYVRCFNYRSIVGIFFQMIMETLLIGNGSPANQLMRPIRFDFLKQK